MERRTQMLQEVALASWGADVSQAGAQEQPLDLEMPVEICLNRPAGVVQEVEAMTMLRPGG